ncbi:type I methionyl aminopeptidase [Candidatus Falkowbacteria bacterium]|nr:type I methionyl aminopeptidase [Candidatus Falkowbacteria bacterium]
MNLIKTEKEIRIMAEGGKILAQVLKKVSQACKPGVSTWELDCLAESLIKEAGGEPSFKGFSDYPKSLCTSINNVLVHGIPKEREIINNGDIVGLDLGLKYKGLYTDMAITLGVGKVSKVGSKLVKVCHKSLDVALAMIKPGNKVGDIGAAVQKYVEGAGFSVVRDLVGHGVGHGVHELPRIPNFGEMGTGEEIKEGMCLAIEPMICEKGYQIKTHKDGWGVETFDNGLAAHFEVTVAVTDKGYEILTK